MIALNKHMPSKAPKEPKTIERRALFLPHQVGSMKDMERVFGIPLSFCKAIRDSGECSQAFAGSNRVNVLPLLRFIGDIFKKLPRKVLAEAMDGKAFGDLDK